MTLLTRWDGCVAGLLWFVDQGGSQTSRRSGREVRLWWRVKLSAAESARRHLLSEWSPPPTSTYSCIQPNADGSDIRTKTTLYWTYHVKDDNSSCRNVNSNELEILARRLHSALCRPCRESFYLRVKSFGRFCIHNSSNAVLKSCI